MFWVLCFLIIRGVCEDISATETHSVTFSSANHDHRQNSQQDGEPLITIVPEVPTDECFTSWKSYDKCVSPSLVSDVLTSTKTFRIRKGVGNGESYQDCDGVPRFRFFSSPTSTTTTTDVITYHETTWKGAYPCKKPDCEVDYFYCEYLYASYHERADLDPNHQFDYKVADTNSLQEYCGGPADECTISVEKEVVLIYWPPTLTSRNICADNGHGTAKTLSGNQQTLSVMSLNEIVFPGPDVDRWMETCKLGDRDERTCISYSDLRIFTLTGPFTFTSPTVYLAHRGITVNGVRRYRPTPREFGFTQLSGVQALKPDDVFSLRPRLQEFFNGSGLDYARLVAKGAFEPNGFNGQIPHDILPFNFGDLQNPVPARAFYDARSNDCWGLGQTHCATITDDTYRPQLAFKRNIWASIIGLDDCAMPEVVDPPIRLLPATTVATPVAPQMGTARPANQFDQPFPSSTGSVNDQDPFPEISRGHTQLHGPYRGETSVRQDSSQDGTHSLNPDEVTHSDWASQIRSAKIGLEIISASFVSGSLVAAYFGTSTLLDSQSATVNGRVISAASNAIFVDGAIAISAGPRVTGGSSQVNDRKAGNMASAPSSYDPRASESGSGPTNDRGLALALSNTSSVRLPLSPIFAAVGIMFWVLFLY